MRQRVNGFFQFKSEEDMQFRRLIWIGLIAISCAKKEKFEVVKLIGHGAVGLHNPSSMYHDNSGEAIDYSLGQAGCDGIEIDMQLSKDGNFWLFHDPNLESETHQSGCISQLNDAFLKDVRYKTLKKERLFPFADISFERLKQKTLILDLRHYDYCAQSVLEVDRFTSKLAEYPQLLNGEIEVVVLLSLKDWLVKFQAFPFQKFYYSNEFEDASHVVTVFPFDGVVMRNDKIDREEVNWMHSHGKKVIIFEVRSPKGIKSALKKHPDFLVTDDLKAAIIEKY